MDSEREMREELRTLRLMLDGSPDLVVLVDDTTEILAVSAALSRMLPLLPSGVIGRSVMDYIHPDDLGVALQTLSQALDEPGEPVRCQLRAGAPGSGYRPLDVVVAAYTGA